MHMAVCYFQKDNEYTLKNKYIENTNLPIIYLYEIIRSECVIYNTINEIIVFEKKGAKSKYRIIVHLVTLEDFFQEKKQTNNTNLFYEILFLHFYSLHYWLVL